jgi:hypothetical protein
VPCQNVTNITARNSLCRFRFLRENGTVEEILKIDLQGNHSPKAKNPQIRLLGRPHHPVLLNFFTDGHLPSPMSGLASIGRELNSRATTEKRQDSKSVHSAVVCQLSFRQIRRSPEGVGTVLVRTYCSLNYSQHECETQIDPRDRLCQLVFVQQMKNGPKHVQRNKDQ